MNQLDSDSPFYYFHQMGKTEVSRRNFLRSAGIAGCLPMIISGCTSSQEKPVIPGNEKKLRFLFQGDSITDGNRGRNEDPNHILGHGYAFSVGSRIGADFPGEGFSFFNRGISGNTVTDLKNRWPDDALQLQPDVLSILVGINDVAAIVEDKPFRQPVEGFETDYRRILLDAEEQNPGIIIILGLPFVFPVAGRKENWEKWKDTTIEHAEAVKKLASDHHAILVDYQQVFERASTLAPIEYWIWDGIHPTVFGHELMAREWITQLGKRLRFLEYYDYSN